MGTLQFAAMMTEVFFLAEPKLHKVKIRNVCRCTCTFSFTLEIPFNLIKNCQLKQITKKKK